MDVIGYVRVSTDEQGRNGHGLGAQREAIERAATYKGWDVEWIEDAGKSAKDQDRPGLQRALAKLENGGPKTIVVAKLDRLTRSMIDFAEMLERAKANGWKLVALDLDVDMTTANGELVANMMVSVAQWERRIIGDRTREGLAKAKAKGVRLGRPRTLPADVVARIVSERQEGRTLQAIADALNDDGVATAQGKARNPKTKGRATSGKWWPSTVASVLRTAERDTA